MLTKSLYVFCITGCISCAGANAESTSPTKWSFDSGWPHIHEVTGSHAAPAVNIVLAEHNTVLDDLTEPEYSVTSGPNGEVDIVYSTPMGILTDRFEPVPELGLFAWRRSVYFKNTSHDVVDITSVHMRVCPLVDGDEWAPAPFRMYRTTSGNMLCIGVWCETDEFLYLSHDHGLEVRFHAAWRLQPGQESKTKYLYGWTIPYASGDFREQARCFYRVMGFKEPLQYPDWLLEGPMYEVSAAGHIESGFSNVGGFDNLIHQLDYLTDLGVSTFWLNAVQAHKIPPNPADGGWNHYAPRDFMQVDLILGGEEGLERLVQSMDERDIQFISEIVPHGHRSIQAEQLEAWWTRDREGELRHNWNGYGMDNASPQWQEVMQASMAMLAERFGALGVRIDVADGQAPNWGSPRTNHASFSGIGACLELMAKLRDGLAQGPANPPILIPESLVNRPIYYTIENAAVLGYGFPFSRMLQFNLEGDLADGTYIRNLVAEYIEREHGSLPPGAHIIWTLNNHDTVADEGPVMLRFGAGLARALYGLCVALPGVPMMYQEEEVGSFFALRAINWARRRVPELIYGEATYGIPCSDPAVFAVLRSYQDNHVVGLINFSGHASPVSVTLPEDVVLGESTKLFDAVSGQMGIAEHNKVTWEMEPYGVSYLRLGHPPEGEMPPLRFTGEPYTKKQDAVTSFSTEVLQDGMRVQMGHVTAVIQAPGVAWRQDDTGDHIRFISDAGEMVFTQHENALDIVCHLDTDTAVPTLTVFDASRWLVSGRTALLNDLFMRRHYPFPEDTDYVWQREHGWGYMPWQYYNRVAPTGRLWESVWEPLHPGNPGMGFIDHQGVGILASSIHTDAQNIVLTDCTDEGTVPPLRLETRFYAKDPDLSLSTRLFGAHSIWRTYQSMEEPSRGLSLGLRLSPVQENANTLLDAQRLPILKQLPMVTKSTEDVGLHQEYFVLPTPGHLTWTHLPPVQGSWRIGLRLRHSEQSGDGMDLADAYKVYVNGTPLELEWSTQNVHSFGNAYIGLALTSPVDLSDTPITLTVESLRPWCIVSGGHFELIPAS